MNHSEPILLMHAVLDGQASPSETLELERQMAASPALRAEFDDLRRICDGLNGVPPKFPPEGLVAAVMSQLPGRPAPQGPIRQLFAASRVIAQDSINAPGTMPGKSARVRGASRQGPNLRGEHMNEQDNGTRGNRKVLIGAGIAAAAVIVAFSTGLFPPGATNTEGTIVPAQRYRAAQPGGDNVVGGTSGAQSGQLNPSAIDASTSNATQSATSKALDNSTSKNLDNATSKAQTNSTNKALENSTNKNLDNATNKALDNSTNKNLDNATSKAQTNSTNKALENSTNKNLDNATNKALENSTNKSLDNATNKNLDNATNKALENSTNKSLEKSTNKALENSTNKTLN